MLFCLGGSGRCLDTASTLGLAQLEAVLEAPRDGFEVAHASGTGSLSPLGFLGPVDCWHVCQARPIMISKYGTIELEKDIHLRVLAAGYPQEAQVLF